MYWYKAMACSAEHVELTPHPTHSHSLAPPAPGLRTCRPANRLATTVSEYSQELEEGGEGKTMAGWVVCRGVCMGGSNDTWNENLSEILLIMLIMIYS